MADDYQSSHNYEMRIIIITFIIIVILIIPLVFYFGLKKPKPVDIDDTVYVSKDGDQWSITRNS